MAIYTTGIAVLGVLYSLMWARACLKEVSERERDYGRRKGQGAAYQCSGGNSGRAFLCVVLVRWKKYLPQSFPLLNFQQKAMKKDAQSFLHNGVSFLGLKICLLVRTATRVHRCFNTATDNVSRGVKCASCIPAVYPCALRIVVDGRVL